MERIEDVTSSSEAIDIPSRFGPAIISGLSYWLAIKRNPQVAPMMKAIYDEDLKNAMEEDRERVSLHLVPQRSLV